MRRLTPQFILEQVNRGEISGRFDAVTLFIDTSGFTLLTAHLSDYGKDGAEVLAEILLTVFEPLIEAVYAHGGFIVGFAGDAFKAVFPQLTPESYLHALAAAEQIRTHMVQQPSHETRYGVFTFLVRVSLADGAVTWAVWSGAAADAQQSSGYTCAGVAIHRAVQGEDHADGGELVATSSFLTALQSIESDLVAYTTLTGSAAGYVRIDRIIGALPTALPHLATEDSLEDSLALASRFYPTALLTMQTQGEFRPVYTVFLNIQRLPEPGSTDDYLPLLLQLLHQYGGYLCRIGQVGTSDVGGTFLLFWGAPTSYENDLNRAFGFLLDLRTQLGIPLRVGVTYAVVYAGFVGSHLSAEYTCHGSKVNQAVRQMTAAKWGQILLDESTAQRAQGDFAVTVAGDFALKGLTGRQSLFALQARHSAGIATPLDARSSPSADLAFVGRDDEAAELQAAIAPIFTGQFAGFTLVSGEAGIGKSRFVDEVLRAYSTSDTSQSLQLFLCQTDEILRESLNPLRYFLRHYFDQRPDGGDATNQEQFTHHLDALIAATSDVALAAELERTRSFLGALVNLHWPDSLYAQLEPQLRFENTLTALKTLILAASLHQPVILLIEDIHWLDEDSRAFLALLTRNVEAYPFAIVATARPQEEAADSTLAEIVKHEIALHPLALHDLAELAQNHLAGAASAELTTLLMARAEGNPFFAEQMLLYLQEQALLVADEDGWQLANDTITSLMIPDDVQTVLIARLDRLAQTVKEVVQTAAVLGREFSVQILSQMLRSDFALDEKVQSAQEAAIWSVLSELRYLFRHTLLRDAAYEMQLRSQVRMLHRSAATAIEQLFATNLASYYADLVYHYSEAGDAVQEQKYAHLAGEQAADRYENYDAILYLSRALALTPATDLEQRFQLLKLRESVYNRQGDREQQAADLAALAALAEMLPTGGVEQIRRRLEVLLSRVNYENHIGDYTAAITTVQQAIALANESQQNDLAESFIYERSTIQLRQGDYAAALHGLGPLQENVPVAQISYSEAIILNIRGIIAMDTGDYSKAQPIFERANLAFQRLGKREHQAGVLGNLALLYQSQNQHTEALRYCEEALALFQRIGHRRGHGNQLETLGNLAASKGDFAQALAFFEQSLQLREEVVDRYGISVLQVNLGFLYIRLAAPAEARSYLEPCLAFTRNAGAKLPQCYALNYLGYLAAVLDEFTVAQALLQESLPITKRIGASDAEGDAYCYLAAVALRQQERNQAAEAYHAAATIFRSVGHQHKLMTPLAGLAELDLLAGDVEAALAKVEEIIGYTAAHFPTDTLDPFQVYWQSYRVLQAASDSRSATLLQNAYALLQAQAATIDDATLRHSFLHNIHSHQEIVRAYTLQYPI